MDKIDVIKKIMNHGSLGDFPEYNDDENIVSVSVIYNPESLCYASDRLRDNEQIVTVAVQLEGRCLEYASDRLKANKQVVLYAVSNNGRSLSFASENLKDDKDIALAAVWNYPYAIRFLSDRLKDDDDVVGVVTDHSFDALEYASERKQFNPLVIRTWLDREHVSRPLVDIIMNAINVANEARGYIQKETIEEGSQKVLSRVPNKSDYNS